jgi:23S rRNA pseudouridine1911/1915/1917 synthase
MPAMSNRDETFILERTLPQDRLDTFLRARYPVVSRGAIQRLIEEGHIRINGRKVKPTHHPRAGEVVEVHWPDASPSKVQPMEIPLDILFEDEDLLVVNKPAGLVVHPASGTELETMVNALLHHCQGSLSGIGGVERPGIVHRLDKETSGCIVVAKNDPTHQALSNQFKERSVEKTYLAIASGLLPHPAGDIRASIARHPSHRKCMTITEGRGREAWTSYRLLETLREASLVEVNLHTGRTHQIRVHFKHIGHPLVGDVVYGKRQTARLEELTGYRPPRFMLHSYRLSFVHPRTGLRKLFQAPIPEDFREGMNRLRLSEQVSSQIMSVPGRI